MRRYISWLAVAVSALTLALVAPSAATAAPPAPTLVSPQEGQPVAGNPVLTWSRVSDAAKYEVAVSTAPDFSGTAQFAQTTVNTYATPMKDLPVGATYWRVRAIDKSGIASVYAQASFIRSSEAKPVLDYPGDGAELQYPDDALSYQWEPVAGAKTYELQVDDDEAFIGAAAPMSTTNTSYSPLTMPAFDTPVFWRVRARSSNNVYSQWSDPFDYTIAWSDSTTVELVGPASTNAVPIEKVVLAWKPIPGAAYYQLDLSPDQNFNAPIYDDAKVVGNTFTPKVSLPAGAYYWRVRPMSTGTVAEPGRWSDDEPGSAWTFTKAWPASAPLSPRPQGTEDDNRFAQVRLLAPANADFGLDQPEFSWSPQRGASHYELQIGSDSNFSPSTYLACFTDHTSLTPFKREVGPSSTCSHKWIVPGAVRYWRVRAVDADTGVMGAFSEVRSFLYDPTHLAQTSPAAGAVVTTPVLTWNPVPNISRYKVTIADIGAASGCTQTLSVTVWSTTYVPETLKRTCAGPWAWTVQGIDDDGSLTRLNDQGTWPTFTLLPETVSTTTPSPVLETTGAAYRPPLLDWPGVTGADGYQINFSVADANSFTPASPKTNQTAWAYTGVTPSGSAFGELLPPGEYDYFVRAFAGSTALTTSQFGRFHIDPMPLTTLSAPAHCPLGSCTAVETDTPTFSWEQVDGAGMYIVYLATDPLFTNITRRFSTQFTSLTPSESLPDSQAGQATYWFVRPCYTAGNCGPFDESVFDEARAFRKETRPIKALDTVPLGVLRADPLVPEVTPVDNSIRFTWTDYLTTNRLDQASPAAPVAPAVDLEAATYELQVSTTANFTAVIDDVKGIDQTTYVSAAGSYPDGPLYARVRAWDNTGNPLTWSADLPFTKSTPAPVGITPTGNQSVTGTPLFQWSPMASAQQYDVEVYKNPDSPVSPTNLVGSVRTRLTTAALATVLPAGQTYGWRVRRIDANGRQGGWSDAAPTSPSETTPVGLARFYVTGPSPVLIAPANDATVTSTSLLFTWGAQARATRYKIDVSTTLGFGTLLETATTDSTAWAPGQISPVWPSSTLYWRVSSLDANNAVIGTSNARWFTRDVSTTGEFTAVTPYRVLDTRRAGGMTGPGVTRNVRLTGGATGIPSSGVSTVVLNVTVTGPTKPSYLSLWAAGQARPSVSTINFSAGQTVANHATVPVNASGQASYFNLTGSTHVILDVVGYYSNGTLLRASRFTAAPAPARIVDTRGVDGAGPTPLHGGESRLVKVAGLGGVPAGSTAVVMNVTAVSPTAAGHLDVYPAGSARPTASNINFPARRNVPNLVTMPIGQGGAVRVYNSAGTTHLLVDVVGWYTPGDPSAGDRYNPVTPTRIVDTRGATAPSMRAGVARSFQVRGAGGVPSSSAARAVVLNVTVTRTAGNGYVTVFESRAVRPPTSSLNYVKGQTVANQVIAKVGVDGKVAVYTNTAADIVVDVVGWMG